MYEWDEMEPIFLILRFGGTSPALSFMKSFTVSAYPTTPSTAAARGRRKHETIQQVLQGERVFFTPRIGLAMEHHYS